MNIALEQATNLRRGTNRTAVLPTAQPHAPARPALPSPPLTRHSETHRASGETPARFTPLPGARPNRAEATAYCDARCADTNKLCGLLSWTSLAGVRSWLAISSAVVAPSHPSRGGETTRRRLRVPRSTTARRCGGSHAGGLLWPRPPVSDPSAHAVWRARRGHKSPGPSASTATRLPVTVSS